MAKIEAGSNSAILAEVDPAFDAMRVSLRPTEMLSWLSVAAQSGALTGAAANSTVFSFRNISSNLVAVRRVGVGFIATTGFTAAQVVDFGLLFARAFTASDSAQTAIALTGSNTKVRTSLGALTSVDCRISNTAAVTVGTRTLDTNHLGMNGGYAGAAAAGVILAPSQDNLFSHNAGDHPIILAQNEGIVITNITAMGAAGVGRLYVNMELAEMSAY